MPAALTLSTDSTSQVDQYVAAMKRAGRQTGRSTVQAARSFCARLERAGGWEELSSAHQADAVAKARSFASWLLVTTQLTVSADLLG
jgi:hypothetical protein